MDERLPTSLQKNQATNFMSTFPRPSFLCGEEFHEEDRPSIRVEVSFKDELTEMVSVTNQNSIVSWHVACCSSFSMHASLLKSHKLKFHASGKQMHCAESQIDYFVATVLIQPQFSNLSERKRQRSSKWLERS